MLLVFQFESPTLGETTSPQLRSIMALASARVRSPRSLCKDKLWFTVLGMVARCPPIPKIWATKAASCLRNSWFRRRIDMKSLIIYHKKNMFRSEYHILMFMNSRGQPQVGMENCISMHINQCHIWNSQAFKVNYLRPQKKWPKIMCNIFVCWVMSCLKQLLCGPDVQKLGNVAAIVIRIGNPEIMQKKNSKKHPEKTSRCIEKTRPLVGWVPSSALFAKKVVFQTWQCSPNPSVVRVPAHLWSENVWNKSPWQRLLFRYDDGYFAVELSVQDICANYPTYIVTLAMDASLK